MDQIDLYFLHRDDLRVPVSEIMDALNIEIGRGRIRSLGASNWTTHRIEEANLYAAQHHLNRFAASQPQWNLAHPNPLGDPTMKFLEPDDALWHTQHQLPVVAYSPTACGYFASDHPNTGQAFDNLISQERRQRARELAVELSVTPNQIALAWLMSQDFPVIPILGTTNPDHQADALRATSIHLSASQREWLRNDSGQPPVRSSILISK